ncbi:MAG: hypothetical protein KDI37_07285 [Xanthomonadales bacterium]|nr:hypothetical protein [Xanthomonadales bacterium]
MTELWINSWVKDQMPTGRCNGYEADAIVADAVELVSSGTPQALATIAVHTARGERERVMMITRLAGAGQEADRDRAIATGISVQDFALQLVSGGRSEAGGSAERNGWPDAGAVYAARKGGSAGHLRRP